MSIGKCFAAARTEYIDAELGQGEKRERCAKKIVSALSTLEALCSCRFHCIASAQGLACFTSAAVFSIKK